MSTRRWARAVLAGAVLGVLAEIGCDSSTASKAETRVATIVVAPANDSILVDETRQLSASAKNARGGALERTVRWSSSDPQVATVTDAGLVRGVDGGTVTITASADGIDGQARLRVRERVHVLTLARSALQLHVQDTVRVALSLLDPHGAALQRAVAWASSDPAVVTVESGLIHGMGTGSATVTAATEGKSAALLATVAEPVASIVLEPGAATLATGQTVQLSAIKRDRSGAVMEHPVAWSSSDTAVAAVDSTGLVSARRPGATVIGAAADAVTANGPVTVLATIAAIRITAPADGLAVAESLQLDASLTDGAGAPVERPVTWTSSAPEVATVDAAGVVTGVAVGVTSIAATSEGRSATVQITVGGAVSSVTLDPPVVMVAEGGTQPVTIVLRDAGGKVVSRAVTWSTASSAVATVSGGGVVRGVSRGETTLTASSGGKSASAPVRVFLPPQPASTIEMSPAEVTVPLGDTLQLVAVAKDAQGQPITRKSFAWSSADPQVATVGASGVVRALTLGATTILATADGRSGRVVVTVSQPVATLEIAPTEATLWAGDTLRLVVTARDANGNSLSGVMFDWSSSAPTVAMVDRYGLVMAAAAGTATITASLGGRSASAAITVRPGVHGVTIHPVRDSVQAGGRVKLGAEATGPDGQPYTGTIVWTSSDTTVARVDQSGWVTGVTPGTATITATALTESASLVITVFPASGDGGSGGSGGNGGGGEGGYGNNLSWPVVFSEGIGMTGLSVSVDNGLRPTSGEGVSVGALPFFYSGNVENCQVGGASYYCQDTAATWQAEWLDGRGLPGPRHAEVDWGDNIENHTWTTHNPIRIEVTLGDLDIGTLGGYNMTLISGSGSSQVRGTDGSTGSFVPTIFSVTPRLTLERIDTMGGLPIPDARALDRAVWQGVGAEGPGNFGAEVNVSGKVVYGYTLMIQNLTLANGSVCKYGWWRFTFHLDDLIDGAPVSPNLSLTRLAAASEEGGGGGGGYRAQLGADGRSSWIDVYIEKGSTGGGGGGGGHEGEEGGCAGGGGAAGLIKRALPTSLHGTASGMGYWYDRADGYGAMIGIPFSSVGCKGCHVYNPALTGTSAATPCLACHPPKAGSTEEPDHQQVDYDKCMGCHGRQAAEISMGFSDVHRAQGMTCGSCHPSAQIHGGDASTNTMFDVLDVTCESCHSSGGSAGAPAASESHTVHGDRIACQACHMSATVTCYNCHFDDEVTKDQRVAKGRFTDWLFLGNHDGKVFPLNFQSVEYQDQTFNAWAPYTGHTISAEGRPCNACHDNANVRALMADGTLPIVWWDPETRTLGHTSGVIPLPPDYVSAFRFDYLTKDATGTWSFLEAGPDRTQMLYATPLTAAQMQSLAKPE